MIRQTVSKISTEICIRDAIHPIVISDLSEQNNKNKNNYNSKNLFLKYFLIQIMFFKRST